MRSLRRVARWRVTSFSRRLTTEMRRRARRRSVSSCVSPGPRVPTPPPSRPTCLPLPRDFLQPAHDDGDAAAPEAAVGPELRLAGPARADAAAEPLEVLPHPAHA